MEPRFIEIWDSSEWARFAPLASHSRNYFKFRSVVRMALWVPITTYIALGLTGWFL